jgi:hypothetical protein
MSSVTAEVLKEESQYVNDLGVDPISETSFMSAIPHPVGKIRYNVVEVVSAVTHTPVCSDVGSGPTWPVG